MNSNTTRAYIGLGSNLAEPIDQIVTALVDLDDGYNCRVIGHSALYRSKPIGPQDQPDFINAVAALETRLHAVELLEYLQVIEQSHGRRHDQEHQRWGPRCLDLDILLYGDAQFNNPELTVPHPGLPARNFVLYPLYEVAPQLIIPGVGRLYTLMKNCPRAGLECLEYFSGSHAS